MTLTVSQHNTRQTIACVLLSIFLFSCASKRADESSIDSTANTVDTTLVTEVAVEEETTSVEVDQVEYGDEEIHSDTAWFSDFARNPLALSSYQGIVDYLQQENIPFKESTADGEVNITFGDSYINVVLNDTYGDLVCSALIDTSAFPLDKGLFIGMERAEFHKITEVSPKSITPDGADGGVFTFDLMGSDGGYWSVTFYFDDKFLTSFRYSLSSCVIYD